MNSNETLDSEATYFQLRGVLGEQLARAVSKAPLTVDEERALVERADEAELQRASLPHVISVVREVGRPPAGQSFLDLVQEGQIGLMRALQTFDFTSRASFSEHARSCIREAVSQAIAAGADPTSPGQNAAAETDWAKLTHAYGPADDVPVALQQLTSSEPADRENGLDTLQATLVHQGSVYSATARAVPELLQIIENRACPEMVDVVGLLYAMVLGRGAASIEADIRQAVLRGQGVLEPLLTHENPKVRWGVVRIFVASFGAASLEALKRRLDEEKDSELRAALWLGIGKFGPTSDRWVPESSPVAALAQTASSSAAPALAQAAEAGVWLQLLSIADRLKGAHEVVRRLVRADPQQVVSRLVEHTSALPREEAARVGSLLLAAVFPVLNDWPDPYEVATAPMRWVVISSLAAPQRMLLTALVADSEQWECLAAALDARGIPSATRRSIAAGLGLVLPSRWALLRPRMFPLAAELLAQLQREAWLDACFVFLDGEDAFLDEEVKEPPDSWPPAAMADAREVSRALASYLPHQARLEMWRVYSAETEARLVEAFGRKGWERVQVS